MSADIHTCKKTKFKDIQELLLVGGLLLLILFRDTRPAPDSYGKIRIMWPAEREGGSGCVQPCLVPPDFFLSLPTLSGASCPEAGSRQVWQRLCLPTSAIYTTHPPRFGKYQIIHQYPALPLVRLWTGDSSVWR